VVSHKFILKIVDRAAKVSLLLPHLFGVAALTNNHRENFLLMMEPVCNKETFSPFWYANFN
jgi:hypothetical protein